jgi:hypothetical protein
MHRLSIAWTFGHGDVQPDANAMRQGRSNYGWKWAFAGHRGSGYLAPSEMHARLKALLERMAKT